MAANAPDIVCEKLTVGYDGHAVVSDMDFTLPAGQISVILGASGCGKSTLLKHILRLHRPISGRVLLGGHDMFSLSGKALHCLKQQIGVLFQDGALLGSLTLGDNVALPLREHTRLKDKDIHKIVQAKLALVGLEKFAAYYPNELSGGMRKRAGLARAMVMDPQMLFVDEPTSGLDPLNSAELDQLLLEMKQHFNPTMVVVSHDLTSMRAVADYVVVLGQGRTLYTGDKEALERTEDPYLRRFLDREAEERETPRLTEARLDPSMFKIDCSKHLAPGNADAR